MSILIREDFEGTGIPSGWVENVSWTGDIEPIDKGVTDWNYSEKPICGNYSLRVSVPGDISNPINRSVSKILEKSEKVLNLFIMYKPSILKSISEEGSDQFIFMIYNEDDPSPIQTRINDKGEVYIDHFDPFQIHSSSYIIKEGEIYHIWFEYSALNICNVFINTTFVKPNIPIITWTDVTNKSFKGLMLLTESEQENIYDNIILSTDYMERNPWCKD
jgi:hypothetical protein